MVLLLTHNTLDLPQLAPLIITDSSLRTADAPIKAALVEKFVDSYGSPRESDSEEKFWIHEGRPWVLWRCGAEQCASSELLQSAYLAVSAAYAGLVYQDQRLIRAGAQSYAYVLRSLQKALSDPEAGKSDAVLMTVGLCMNYEVGQLTYSVFLTPCSLFNRVVCPAKPRRGTRYMWQES